ncbi:hypothetical protein ACP4OV_001999 [Aristida adscensionis]
MGLGSLWASAVCAFLLWLTLVMFICDPETLGAACASVFLWPISAIALFLFLLLLVGCYGLISKQEGILVLYRQGVIFLALACIGFFIFSIVAVAGIEAEGEEPREYKLSDSKGWLARHVSHSQYWDKISTCLRNKNACDGMTLLVREPKTGMLVPAFHGGKISPIQICVSGCCKPPSSCPYTYINETVMWIPTSGVPSKEIEIDCSRWSNDHQTLCFHHN